MSQAEKQSEMYEDIEKENEDIRAEMESLVEKFAPGLV